MSLSPGDTADTFRFTGYPIQSAISTQAAGLQTTMQMLAGTLAALSSLEAAYVQATLVTLRLLEADVIGVRANADTKQAAVWYRNPDELAERERLYLTFRARLCSDLGIPPGPGLITLGDSAYGLPPAVFVV